MNNVKFKNIIFGTNRKVNVLEEVKRDLKIEESKNNIVEGYKVSMRLLKLIPKKYRELVYLDEKDNSLWFDSFRLGKFTEIDYIVENHYLGMVLNIEIIIGRAKEKPIRIEFKHGKSELTNKYDYLDFSVAFGY